MLGFVRVELLIEATTKVTQLEARLAAHLAHMDWLMAHVNRLEQERAVLFQRTLNLQMPVPEILRMQSQAPTPSQGLGRNVAVEDDYGQTIPGVQAMGAFDDIGDEAARVLGITHDRQGQVAYTR